MFHFVVERFYEIYTYIYVYVLLPFIELMEKYSIKITLLHFYSVVFTVLYLLYLYSFYIMHSAIKSSLLLYISDKI